MDRLTYKRILSFWLPLEATWLMMALEGTFESALIARMAEPKLNLAAYGIAFSLTLVIEAPILTIISASNVLVHDRNSFIKLRTFTYFLAALLTSLMGILLLPGIFYPLVERGIGLPAEVVELTHWASLLLLPVPWAIGYRRFYHGILIRNNRTRMVALGTAIRLFSMVLSGLGLYLFSPMAGSSVARSALSIGVILEAVISRIMAGDIVRGLLSESKPSGSSGPLTYRDINRFYLPLALTALLALGVNPLVTFFVGQSRMAIESLAVLPVISALLFLFTSCGLSFQEASIALIGHENQNYKKLRNFALALGLATVLLLGLIGFTPLSALWFQTISGLSRDLAQFALIPTQILTLLPGFWVFLTFQRSLLVNSRQTGPITWGTGLEVILVLAVLLIGIHYLEAVGAIAAAAALLIGRIGSAAYLLPPYFRIVRGVGRKASVPTR